MKNNLRSSEKILQVMASHGNQTKHLELYYYRILRHSILLYKRCIAIKIAKFILFCEGDLLHYRLLYFWNTFLLFMMRHSRFIVFFAKNYVCLLSRKFHSNLIFTIAWKLYICWMLIARVTIASKSQYLPI